MDDYRFEIFATRAVPRSQLHGTVYRFWAVHALAWVCGRRLSGRIDFLDAGGRDGLMVELLENLSLSGTYTCLDLHPVVVDRPGSPFQLHYVQSPFREFRPTRQYDAILFMSSLEFVADLREVAWVPAALKPGGFAVVAVIGTDTEPLYPGFWAAGGSHGRDRDQLIADFAAIGLRAVEVIALVGAAGRAAQSLLQLKLGRYVNLLAGFPVRRLFPGWRIEPMAPLNRAINESTARLDRLFRFSRIGNCVVLEPSSQT